jgi:membrane protein implicated in regulation of membrane protease activity
MRSRLLWLPVAFVITGAIGVHFFHKTWTYQAILFAIIVAVGTVRRGLRQRS